MPVESKDIEKVRQLVRQREAIRDLKKAFNTANRFSIRALDARGNVVGEIVRRKNENVFITEVLKQFRDNMDAQIATLEAQISAAGVTP